MTPVHRGGALAHPHPFPPPEDSALERHVSSILVLDSGLSAPVTAVLLYPSVGCWTESTGDPAPISYQNIHLPLVESRLDARNLLGRQQAAPGEVVERGATARPFDAVQKAEVVQPLGRPESEPQAAEGVEGGAAQRRVDGVRRERLPRTRPQLWASEGLGNRARARASGEGAHLTTRSP
ncbi:hypothetical protein VTK73DRAFT_4104 [Phialemonium thermophilum]|uniref:Uncharacterized protein n=1 Tax=Phialemonium thermophilum TaxID=223376 RepID=A0ABR3VDK0_9PEZI